MSHRYMVVTVTLTKVAVNVAVKGEGLNSSHLFDDTNFDPFGI